MLSGEEGERQASLQPGGPTPKRMRGESRAGAGWSRQAAAGGEDSEGAAERSRGEGAGARQVEHACPGFSVDSGSAVMIAGSYVVRAIQTQVVLQGMAGREIWLAVDLRRGGANITGWVQSGELQRRVASGGGWLARLMGKGRGGWGVEEHSWVCGEGSAMTGHGLRGAVVGWYLPVLIVDEKRLSRNGVRVVVMMRKVAMGKGAGGFGQAVGHGDQECSGRSGTGTR